MCFLNIFSSSRSVFTLDKKLPGPDHKASLNPQELSEVISKIRMAELSLGNGEKIATQSELEIRKVVRKSIFLVANKNQGDVIAPDDIRFLRPGTGLSPKNRDQIIGSKAARDLSEGTELQWSDLVI